MSRSEDHERLPEDLQEVADVLRERRPSLEPLELDRIKLRAMSGARRSASSRQGRFSARSRLVAFLTVAMLALGTGSALAGFFDFGGGYTGYGDGGSASWHQYRPPCRDGYGYASGKCYPNHNHHWYYRLGWCWLPNGHGGYTWGYGYGWCYE